MATELGIAKISRRKMARGKLGRLVSSFNFEIEAMC